NDKLPRIPAIVWHLINSVSKVINVFDYCIPEEEMESFFEKVDVEAEIEVSFSHETMTDEDQQEAEQEALHVENMTGEQVATETTVDKVNKLKEKANGKLQQMIGRCKAYIQRKKETFIFPVSLYMKTRKRIDPHNRMKNRTINDGNFLILEIIKTLEMEISLQ